MMQESTASSVGVAGIALLNVKGLGRKKALSKLEQCPLDADWNEARRWFLGTIDDSAAQGAWEAAELQVEACERTGVRVVSYFDAGFPARLRDIPDPPLALYVKGPLAALHQARSVAIVGTREPTEFGAKAARSTGLVASESSAVVVSGLAIGCDTWAHTGCMEGAGTGIAVLAHGLDKVYPAQNRELADELLEKDGCLVSEYPIGKKPDRWAFAERDRLQSGLSDAVLVVETDLKGGTMHTVNAARGQKRPLACIQHPAELLSEAKTRGNQKLIAEGATPILDRRAFGAFVESMVAHAAMAIVDSAGNPPVPVAAVPFSPTLFPLDGMP